MAGGSLIFKQDSEYYEYFYHQLEPWVHYIPLKRDISDVVEKVEWAVQNDDKVRNMVGGRGVSTAKVSGAWWCRGEEEGVVKTRSGIWWCRGGKRR